MVGGCCWPMALRGATIAVSSSARRDERIAAPERISVYDNEWLWCARTSTGCTLSMESLLQDVRVTLRAFRRSPGFPLTAIATLALGIGATTAIFTTLSAVLLKPLPYPRAEDLYSLRTALTDGRVTTGLLSGGEIFRLNDPKLAVER